MGIMTKNKKTKVRFVVTATLLFNGDADSTVCVGVYKTFNAAYEAALVYAFGEDVDTQKLEFKNHAYAAESVTSYTCRNEPISIHKVTEGK